MGPNPYPVQSWPGAMLIGHRRPAGPRRQYWKILRASVSLRSVRLAAEKLLEEGPDGLAGVNAPDGISEEWGDWEDGHVREALLVGNRD